MEVHTEINLLVFKSHNISVFIAVLHAETDLVDYVFENSRLKVFCFKLQLQWNTIILSLLGRIIIII